LTWIPQKKILEAELLMASQTSFHFCLCFLSLFFVSCWATGWAHVCTCLPVHSFYHLKKNKVMTYVPTCRYTVKSSKSVPVFPISKGRFVPRYKPQDTVADGIWFYFNLITWFLFHFIFLLVI
jgi:hypothetical protein